MIELKQYELLKPAIKTNQINLLFLKMYNFLVKLV
jgi:hypothetical protein